MKPLCTICARGGSKGVPGKNLRVLLGKPLIAHTIEQAFAKTIQQGKVTYDLERLMAGATKVKTSEFAKAIVENM